ncbi:hypothetical protein [Pseudoalteromonas piscicida]|uniref:hypothetical protein n=1 Tax=Pseudoalteromonas piscicida TaxID=43662 RepID=UPI0027E50D2F|nr:hypothetical protein [Pseudoalteromonas piscicida]WMO14341.1 hypothetical protein NI376_01470 [Pseudoalteromonas piscicida]
MSIESKDEYVVAFARAEVLIGKLNEGKATDIESKELDELVNEIAEYEDKHYSF